MPRKLSFEEGMAMNRASGVFTEEELQILAGSPAQEAAQYLFEGKVPSSSALPPAKAPYRNQRAMEQTIAEHPGLSEDEYKEMAEFYGF